MKVGCQSYRGIEFVCYDDLPLNQQILLNAAPESLERIKILIHNKTVANCILYKDYEQWFHSVYRRSAVPAQNAASPLEMKPVTLAFDQA
jgi:hypothetical protein